MNTLLNDLLDLIRQKLRSDALLVPAGATAEELNDLDVRMRREFSVPLTPEYRELLSNINGFCVGPFTVAGTSRQPLRRADGTPYCDVEVPDLVTHAGEIAVDYAPQFEGLITVNWGPALCGWDPRTQTWFRGYYETGISRTYGDLNELLADLLYDSDLDSPRLMPTSFRFTSPDAAGRPVFGARK